MNKILIIHRYYRHRGGEDVFLDHILLPSLQRGGIAYDILKFEAFFTKGTFLESVFEMLFMVLGLETLRPSYAKVKKQLTMAQYSSVLLNNFIPSISLAVPQEVRARKIKLSAWVHNFRALCANGLLFNGKVDCNKCVTAGSIHAFLQNCNHNHLQSLLYAWIYRGRRIGKLVKYVHLFICNSNYTQSNLNRFGFLSTTVLPMPPRGKITADAPLPNGLAQKLAKFGGKFYLFAGRISHEKGADIFSDLARKYSDKAFVICGDGPEKEKISATASPNLFFHQATQDELQVLYRNCEALIVPSRVKETSSLVISEAYPHGTPIVFPAGGGAEETVKALSLPGMELKDFKGDNFTLHKKEIPENQTKNLIEQFDQRLKELFA